MSPMITVDKKALADFCKKRHVRKLSLFGSAVRADFKTGSDLDLLVEFETNHTPGLAFFSLAEELSAFFGHQVDLNTSQSLSPYFRDQVISESENLYDASRP
jgi:predicted nucleotidyltransferase